MKVGKKLAFVFKILLVCAVSAGLAWSFNSLRPVPPITMQQSEIVEIDGVETLKIFDSNEAVFVDARSDTDFAMGHIPGAVNVPSWAIGIELDGLITSIPKDKMIVVYCDGLSCGKSNIVARKLRDKGFSDLAVYPDGLDGWLSLGRDLEGN
ncbi:rhodanese-like domain-containing protein [Maridesulfovibrio ferrireducens]|uniref:rhodanese-like domain-containing protein n=1 Tax=Maridesulfovibrio ferrireducens TaxID=246191 RepID=UPI001A1E3445|nr:rhodanese-like domain-containing protein [Maridesulfovibrio ferrireducens]MBI9110075.1 rhodanese-like domain-containing protein [Maridesulfovibrio ferrireducens]